MLIDGAEEEKWTKKLNECKKLRADWLMIYLEKKKQKNIERKIDIERKKGGGRESKIGGKDWSGSVRERGNIDIKRNERYRQIDRCTEEN